MAFEPLTTAPILAGQSVFQTGLETIDNMDLQYTHRKQ